MNTGPGMVLTPSTETWPSVNPSVSGNGAGRRLLTAAVLALAVAVVLLSAACGGGKEAEPLKLVPEDATLIGEIEVADILGKVDLDSLLDALPAEEDGPQTIDGLLDLVAGETGLDLRDISRFIVFGDPQREDDYFGIIGRGTFDEERLAASIQEAAGASFSTETYKGRDLHISEDDADDFVFTLLHGETLLLGNLDAVRDTIDVQEGDRNRAEGNVYDALNDLPRGLIRLSLAAPSAAFHDEAGPTEGLFGQQGLFGGLPVSLESCDQLEIFSFALGQDGDTSKLQVRLDFADQESASAVGDLLDGLFKVAGSLLPDEQVAGFLGRIQVDHGGNTLTLRLELVAEELEKLLEGLLNITSEESGTAEVTIQPRLQARSIGPGQEVDIMPTSNHAPDGRSVAYSTTPPTSGDHRESWADRGFYPDGLPDELIVHNLEHGNIVVSYNLSEEQDIAALNRTLAGIGLAEEWGVVRSYDKMPEGTVAVAAWGRLDTMPGVDRDRMASFFAAYAGVMGPERIAC